MGYGYETLTHPSLLPELRWGHVFSGIVRTFGIGIGKEKVSGITPNVIVGRPFLGLKSNKTDPIGVSPIDLQMSKDIH